MNRSLIIMVEVMYTDFKGLEENQLGVHVEIRINSILIPRSSM